MIREIFKYCQLINATMHFSHSCLRDIISEKGGISCVDIPEVIIGIGARERAEMVSEQVFR